MPFVILFVFKRSFHCCIIYSSCAQRTSTNYILFSFQIMNFQIYFCSGKCGHFIFKCFLVRSFTQFRYFSHCTVQMYKKIDSFFKFLCSSVSFEVQRQFESISWRSIHHWCYIRTIKHFNFNLFIWKEIKPQHIYFLISLIYILKCVCVLYF